MICHWSLILGWCIVHWLVQQVDFLAEKVWVKLAGRQALRAGRSSDKKSASLRPIFLGVAGGGRRDVEVGIIRPPEGHRGHVRRHPLQWNGRYNLWGLRINFNHLKNTRSNFPDFGTRARKGCIFIVWKLSAQTRCGENNRPFVLFSWWSYIGDTAASSAISFHDAIPLMSLFAFQKA